MFKCKVFGLNCPKILHLPLVRRSAPVEIRIVTMAEFHKSGPFEPFLWNCAATAARINRKAVYSVDIIVADTLIKLKPGLRPAAGSRAFRKGVQGNRRILFSTPTWHR